MATAAARAGSSTLVTLFLCGDVMLGRGIDQILRHPSNPVIYEGFMDSAEGYVQIAEQINGQIPRNVTDSYVWGDALVELDRVAPDARIINLETSVTSSEDYWRGKGINYRMNPRNAGVITAAKSDVCILSNNHVLDWGYPGLAETLDTMKRIEVRGAGAGANLSEAMRPAIVELPSKNSRVVVFAYGMDNSGVFHEWAANAKRAGVNFLRDFSEQHVLEIRDAIAAVRRPGDVVVFSIHWDHNWGYDVRDSFRTFSHQLIDHAHVDVLHGHSSHHPKEVEIYNDKVIFYGCGDFINDYEGIKSPRDAVYHPELTLMYFPTIDSATGKLVDLEMVPLRMRKFRLQHATKAESYWLGRMLFQQAGGKANVALQRVSRDAEKYTHHPLQGSEEEDEHPHGECEESGGETKFRIKFSTATTGTS